jgi:hypothetical protein
LLEGSCVSMSKVTVIPERVSKYPQADSFIFHLMKGEWDEAADWQPIVCGDGIVFPYRSEVDSSEVCPNCIAEVLDNLTARV